MISGTEEKINCIFDGSLYSKEKECPFTATHVNLDKSQTHGIKK